MNKQVTEIVSNVVRSIGTTESTLYHLQRAKFAGVEIFTGKINEHMLQEVSYAYEQAAKLCAEILDLREKIKECKL